MIILLQLQIAAWLYNYKLKLEFNKKISACKLDLQFKLQLTVMEHSLNQEQKSMMRSVSKNIIGNFQLDPITLYSSNKGEIYHITNRIDKNSLILKVIWKKNNNNTYKNQKKIHCSLKNRYIVQLENTFQDQNQYYLVLEYCKGGTLRKAMTAKLSQELAKQYALQIAKGISYLHKNKVIHHDIRPENILLTLNNQIKICDFGRAVNFEEGKNVKGCEEINQYSPPQGIQKHNEKYDVWSLGCLIFQMVTGKQMFSFQNWKQSEKIMKKQKIQNILSNSDLNPTLIHLLNKIFVIDFQQRVSIDQVIKHSFFTGQSLQNSIKESKKQPIIAKKKSSKTMFKSLELKQSNYHKENKENCNRINLTNKQNPPNYREMIDKKMKKIDKQTETSRPSSGERKEIKIKGMKHIDYDVKNKVFSDQKRNISPLNTLNMRIAPLKIKNNQIRIDKTGITRETLIKDQISQSINISCDGKTIRMKKGIKEKVFNFDLLPVQYYKEYQQCKHILRQIQSQEVRLSYVDKNYRNDKILQIKIMYNDSLYIKIDDELELKQIKVQQFLANTKNISEQYFKQLKNIYLKLAVMNKLT